MLYSETPQNRTVFGPEENIDLVGILSEGEVLLSNKVRNIK